MVFFTEKKDSAENQSKAENDLSHRATKKKIWFVLKLIVSMGLLLYLITGVQFASVLLQWEQANIYFLFFGGIVYLISIFVVAFRWKVTLSAMDIEVPLRNVFSIYFMGFFFNNFLPSSAGGDIMRIYYITGKTQNKTGAFSSVFVERLLGFFTLVFFGLLSLFFLNFFEYQKIILMLISGINLLFILLIVFIFYENILVRIKSGIKKIEYFNIGEKFDLFLQSTRMFEHPLRFSMYVFILSFIYQFLMTLFCYLISLGLGLNISFGQYLVFVPVMAIASLIPITINGLGVREGVWIFLFHSISKSKETALSLSLLTYFIGLMISLIGGIIFIFYERGRRGGKVHGSKAFAE